MTTGAFNRNVGKLFFEVKLVTDNLSLHEANQRTKWNSFQFLSGTTTCISSLCSSRYFHWQLNLYCMLVMLICVIPLYIAQQLVNTIRIGKSGGRRGNRVRGRGREGEGEEEGEKGEEGEEEGERERGRGGRGGREGESE